MSEDRFLLGARVFDYIREGILSGKYKPKEELKEKNIGDELGVSRTPVREALRQLELEGLVSIIPNKGAYVEGISINDIRDIYEMRILLEGLCAKWAARNITKEQIEELEENIFLAEFHSQKGNWQQMVEIDNRFHELLYVACGSKELSKLLRDYHHYVQRVRKVTLRDPQRVQQSTLEHKMIAAAVCQHQEEEAEQAAQEHLKNTITNMSQFGWDKLMEDYNYEKN